ncbi:MAG: hypothetical protein II832_11050 [Synergistaceae bacterium]|nr:hypothetical protein [Synergistaceae bacterium]
MNPKHLFLTPELDLRLRVFAAVEGTTQSSVVRAALREFFSMYRITVPEDMIEVE